VAIDIPQLDDKGYGEILEEAMQLLPVYSEQWTDHNAHDPGITILETLAWIAETYAYQHDQVTDTHREAYLKLLGDRPKSPTPATVALQASLPESEPAVTIAAGSTLEVEDGSTVSKLFETVSRSTIRPAQIDAVVSVVHGQLADNTRANAAREMHFQPFGPRAPRESLLYLGFDDDPFAGEESLTITVRLQEEDYPAPASHGTEVSDFDPSVTISWQYCIDPANWEDDTAWESLTVLSDDTNRFYDSGDITLSPPSDRSLQSELNAPRREASIYNHTGLYWIRCRLEQPGYEIPPLVDVIRINTFEAHHRVAAEHEPLERVNHRHGTTGLSNQQFILKRPPVLEADIVVGTETWVEVPDFDASGPDDPHYVLSHEEGTVSFGDGIRGRCPAAGQAVVAKRYVTGGGTVGNVPRGSNWHFRADEKESSGSPPLESLPITQLGPATGGHDAESIDAAVTRVKRALKPPTRAVTLDDHEYLAMHTPGLRFGRAVAVRRQRKHGQTEVAVTVVPFSPSSVRPPKPSDGFLEAVKRHLERHRLLTERVAVEPPVYVDVEIDASVRIHPGRHEQGRATAIQTAIQAYLDPLTGYDGTGWPFGRPLYRSEIYELIERVNGVDHVLDISITPGTGGRLDADGNVLLTQKALISVSDDDLDIGAWAVADGGV
jgi:hypothetical protein